MAVHDRRTRWTLGLTAVSALLIFTAGCGGSDDNDGTGAAGGADGTNSLAAYTKCLKEQGIDVPDLPTGRPSGGPRPDGTAGRPSGGPRPDGSGAPPGFPSGRPSGAPSPGASGRPGDGGPGGGPGGPGGGFGNLRPEGVDDATWQKAQEACRSVLPTGGPGRGQNGGNGQSSNGQSGNGEPGTNAAYANCLSDRGVRLTTDLNTADPTVAEALKACQVLSPAPSATPGN